VTAPRPPTFGELTRVFLRIGLLSFGGPAGQIAMMHKELVDDRRWISDARFLHALNYCMLLPGPEAQQLATYIGWLLHRTPGALVAGGLFVLPGFLLILALSAIYAVFHRVPVVEGALFGLKAAVIAIVLEALVRVGKRALKSGFAVWMAVGAFVALAVFAVPFPFVIAGAAALGLVFGPRGGAGVDGAPTGETESVVDGMFARGELAHAEPSRRRALVTLAVTLALWVAPLAILCSVAAPDSVYVKQAEFFAKNALVTFGGAYAVLTYVAQQAVETYGWLSATAMVDALGLAETTPGPLILVLEFVGFLGAYNARGTVGAGVLGACLTVWMTFAPCFMFVLVGAPWIESLRKSAVLARILAAVTAAVVGVIANLSLFFAEHALFRRVEPLQFGPVRASVPVLASIDVAEAVLAALAIALLFKLHVSVLRLVLGFAAAGVALHFALHFALH
jgi:chromate transporter